jgi:multicomponent Na+:H+ antiporter subunit B
VSRPARLALALAGLAGLVAALVAAVGELHPFGHYPGPYGDVLAHVVPRERHTGQLVAAVTFDYRGFDTMGEEIILFGAACGCAALLRLRRRERDGRRRPEPRPAPSLAARAMGAAMVGPVLVFAAYVVVHGHLTPGGGFSGGVVAAGGLLLAYAAGQRVGLRRVPSNVLLEATEALGALGFLALALAGLLVAGVTLQNVLPLGTMGMLLSAGTIPLGNVTVGLEVCAAVALVLSEFLEQALLEEPR